MEKGLDMLSRLITAQPVIDRRDFFTLMAGIATAAFVKPAAAKSRQRLSDLQLYEMRLLVHDPKTAESQEAALEDLVTRFTESYGFDCDAFLPYYSDDTRVFYHDLLKRQQEEDIDYVIPVEELSNITAWTYSEPHRIGLEDTQAIYVHPRFFELKSEDALATLFFTLNSANDTYNGFEIKGELIDIDSVTGSTRYQMLVIRSYYETLKFIEDHDMKVTQDVKEYFRHGFLDIYHGIQAFIHPETDKAALSSQVKAFDYDFVGKMKNHQKKLLPSWRILKSRAYTDPRIEHALYTYDESTGPILKKKVIHEM